MANRDPHTPTVYDPEKTERINQSFTTTGVSHHLSILHLFSNTPSHLSLSSHWLSFSHAALLCLCSLFLLLPPSIFISQMVHALHLPTSLCPHSYLLHTLPVLSSSLSQPYLFFSPLSSLFLSSNTHSPVGSWVRSLSVCCMQGWSAIHSNAKTAVPTIKCDCSF